MKSSNASREEFLAAREATGPAPVSLWQILRGYRSDPLERWTGIRREHGPVAHYRFGLSDTFFLSSAEGVKRILQDNPANYTKEHPSYGMLRRLFGNGLFTSEGSFWLRQRRLAQPAFHRERIAEMAGRMTAAAEETAARWETLAVSGEPVSMLREMAGLTLRVVGDTLFGASLSARTSAVTGAWEVLNAQLAERYNRRRMLPPILPTRYDRDFRQARRSLLRIVEEIIAVKRRHADESGDLLSIFMHARDEDTGERMTDGQLRDEVITMLFAGHETTAIALTWAWLLLARHPEAAATLHDELGEVLGGRAPTMVDVPRLRFTRCIVDEVLRLHPPAYILNRHVRNDDVVCGCRVHRGGSVVISPVVLHRHPDYWDRPDEFEPRRWLDGEAEARRPKFAYLPFGGGPRLCIGHTFALTEAVLILATLAQRFETRIEEGYVPSTEFLVVARPAEGAPMRVRRRRAATSPARPGEAARVGA
jgi:cytochrome P450